MVMVGTVRGMTSSLSESVSSRESNKAPLTLLLWRVGEVLRGAGRVTGIPPLLCGRRPRRAVRGVTEAVAATAVAEEELRRLRCCVLLLPETPSTVAEGGVYDGFSQLLK